VNPYAPRPPHFKPRATAVISLFMGGGWSQVDTFDPKPMLAKYAGQAIPLHMQTERRTGAGFPSPFTFIPQGQSGIEVSEIFPEVGKCIDDICVIRSMMSEIPNHEPSLMMMNCGDVRQVRPSFGSWVTYGLGSENQNLPGFVVVLDQKGGPYAGPPPGPYGGPPPGPYYGGPPPRRCAQWAYDYNGNQVCTAFY